MEHFHLLGTDPGSCYFADQYCLPGTYCHAPHEVVINNMLAQAFACTHADTAGGCLHPHHDLQSCLCCDGT